MLFKIAIPLITISSSAITVGGATTYNYYKKQEKLTTLRTAKSELLNFLKDIEQLIDSENVKKKENEKDDLIKELADTQKAIALLDEKIENNKFELKELIKESKESKDKFDTSVRDLIKKQQELEDKKTKIRNLSRQLRLLGKSLEEAKKLVEASKREEKAKKKIYIDLKQNRRNEKEKNLRTNEEYKNCLRSRERIIIDDSYPYRALCSKPEEEFDAKTVEEAHDAYRSSYTTWEKTVKDEEDLREQKTNLEIQKSNLQQEIMLIERQLNEIYVPKNIMQTRENKRLDNLRSMQLRKISANEDEKEFLEKKKAWKTKQLGEKLEEIKKIKNSEEEIKNYKDIIEKINTQIKEEEQKSIFTIPYLKTQNQ